MNVNHAANRSRVPNPAAWKKTEDAPKADVVQSVIEAPVQADAVMDAGAAPGGENAEQKKRKRRRRRKKKNRFRRHPHG